MVQAFARFEAAIRADQVERDAKVAEGWGDRSTTPAPKTVWHAIGISIAHAIRQKGSDHEG